MPSSAARTQCVDRCLGNHNARGVPSSGQAEQRFAATSNRTSEVGSADFDMRDPAALAPMGEPGTAVRTLPNCVGALRRGHDEGRQPAFAGQIAPCGRAGAKAWPRPPAFRQGVIRAAALRRAQDCRGGWNDANEGPQNLPYLAEVDGGVEILHQVEDVASRRAQRIPPAAAVMVDDEDLTRSPPILERPARASLAIEAPRREKPFEQRGAVHVGSQQVEFVVLAAHGVVLLIATGG